MSDFENLESPDVEIAADTLLEEIAQRESEIKLAEQERDAFIAHYNEKILRAEEICERKTREARESIVFLTEELRRYAVTQISDKKRSVTLPSGTLQFRKQEPKFFYDDLSEANAKDARLIHFVKNNAYPYLKVKVEYPYLKVKVEETVDWAKFKRRLTISDDGSCVSFKDTGEIIDGLRAQHLPDKFSIKLGGSS